MKHHLIRYIAIICLLQFSTLASADGWEYRLSPYAWFAGLKGDVGAFPGLPAVPVDVSSSDALNDTETALMLAFDAKKNGHGIFVDFLFSDVQSEEDLIPEIGLTAKSINKTTMLTAAYEYEAYRNGGAVLDLLAGLKYWNIDSTLKARGGLSQLAGQALEHEESWVDPFIGIKGRTSLGESRFYVSGGGGIGGFGAGSDQFYSVNANIGYQWSESIGTSIGYRQFEVEYDDDGFFYDVKQNGWQAALTWAF